MRSLVLAQFAATALLVLAGCDDATGALQGGEALEGSTAPTSLCDPTWTSLYGTYFGPLGLASCAPSGNSSCHGAADQAGASFSGFVCGSTQDECWQGMTQGIAADAGGGNFPPILPPDGGDPTQSYLWVSIHKTTSNGGLNNMPCGNPPSCTASVASYTFMSDALSCLSAWAQAGAPNN